VSSNYHTQTLFSALRKLGEHPWMKFALLEKSSRQLSWFELPHTEFDGMGGSLYITKQFPGKISIDYDVGQRTPPSLWKKLTAILCYLPETKLRKECWQHYHRQDPSRSYKVVIHLDQDGVKKIKEDARISRSHLQNYILKRLDRVVSNQLQSNNSQERWWMLPINMRENKNKFSQKNWTSYISMPIENGESERNIQQIMIGKLKAYEQWGAWFVMRLLSRLGSTISYRCMEYYDRNHHEWCGIFTYQKYRNLLENNQWSILGIAPITKAHPIACNVIEDDNSLVIASQMHHGLFQTEEQFEQLTSLLLEELNLTKESIIFSGESITVQPIGENL
jgi:hypothetical protein